MAGPQVYFTWPSSFQPIPSPLPQPLPPPVKERSFRSPFGIDKTLFDFALRPEVPILFATTYIFTVFALNAYNRKRQHKPWSISKTRVFHCFVVLHNVLLALYSAATFAAMLRAILHTWPEGGITSNPNGAAGVADALCKLHGPRGLGDAATFNTTINIWEVKNTAIRLGYDGNPDPTDVGRLWNEGLAFWGFIFYMSKFYEVVDTMIIIAKGKRSATLQTYHHAGAMLCMWAGIRFMSPPIWMFVFINSAIHAMMYTYFTLSALGYRVPQALKRTLTSLQIAQFLFGASYAAMHLFVQYDIPISTPYYVASTVQRAASSASSAAASITASASSDISSAVASPTATATLGALLKKLLLRAAGEEGLAERVHRERRSNPANLIPTPGLVPDLPTVPDMADKIQQFNEETFYETRWRTDWTKVDCIDTSGEAFAIYLNLLYLAPLTFLFGRFFVKAYTQRGRKGRARSISEAAKQALVAGIEGEKKTEEAVEAKGKKVESKAPFDDEATKKLEEQVREDVRRLKDGSYKGSPAARKVSERVQSYEGKMERAAEKGTPTSGKKEVGSGAGGVENREPPVTPTKNQKKKMRKAAKQQESPQADRASGVGMEGTKKDESEKTYSDAVQAEGGAGEEDDNKENDAPGLLPTTPRKSPEKSTAHTAGNESEPKQDENIAASQPVRPGASEEGNEKGDAPLGVEKEDGKEQDDNPDAMGKSGSIIDLAKEKAEDVIKDEGSDPTLPQSRPGSGGAAEEK
ncbi:hypothetical protein KC327_g4620 [Hortaea werneckii]|nr:hypothetical protein KC358_g4707 [Hortaea werneckii]KAI6846668.1 hypothetical protein KC350_g3797 [Hortaea werneckii]KAI6935344.1 hypothetical protein KC348_g6261 [Hortaea werneckii]KAI6937528.1 hypothetical protein KC341_g5506 [Hortaea werneckii]KAI6970984.1 hypothetical protein KC321_g7015 [Hortaea werneckii]